MTTSYCDYLDAVRRIAIDAGARIVEVYEESIQIDFKKDGSPLTAADVASHALIIERLTALTPAIPILSEELAEAEMAARRTWTRYWLVDPLDGTKEFINRNGEFTVNIALIDGHAPVLGVVYVPVLDAIYSACRGLGAFKQNSKQPAQPIRVRTPSLAKPIVVVSRSHADPVTEAFLSGIGPHDVVSMGSSLKFCLVAEGMADVYPRLGPTTEWDTAAAQCIVECAGGRVTDIEGNALTYNKDSLLNPWFIVSGSAIVDWCQHVPARDK